MEALNKAEPCSAFFQPGTEGPFMLLRQTGHMKRLLSLYGSIIIGMDGTYKTNIWGFPL